MKEVRCLDCGAKTIGADDAVISEVCSRCTERAKRIEALEDKVIDLQGTVKILEDHVDQQAVQISLLKSRPQFSGPR